VPSSLTEITEISTALGTLAPDLASAIAVRPDRLQNVTDLVWSRLVTAYEGGDHSRSFERAFANGTALLHAKDGLRARSPKLVEWKGPHRPPGDDVIPADIRIDHVYLVSCKYLSKISQNPGPARLFDRLLVGEDRARSDWFDVVAPSEYQRFYTTVRTHAGTCLPERVTDLSPPHRAWLKEVLKPRALPAAAHEAWMDLCRAVASASASRWDASLHNHRARLRLLWRLLRIGDASYFVLGTDGRRDIRLRVASAWDWMQDYELCGFLVTPRDAGQPEVGWTAEVRERSSGGYANVQGHIEIRWSHGRFQGAPEAKVYLDTPLNEIPGYFDLA
jgi:hypothetical protein